MAPEKSLQIALTQPPVNAKPGALETWHRLGPLVLATIAENSTIALNFDTKFTGYEEWESKHGHKY